MPSEKGGYLFCLVTAGCFPVRRSESLYTSGLKAIALFSVFALTYTHARMNRLSVVSCFPNIEVDRSYDARFLSKDMSNESDSSLPASYGAYGRMSHRLSLRSSRSTTLCPRKVRCSGLELVPDSRRSEGVVQEQQHAVWACESTPFWKQRVCLPVL